MTNSCYVADKIQPQTSVINAHTILPFHNLGRPLTYKKSIKIHCTYQLREIPDIHWYYISDP